MSGTVEAIANSVDYDRLADAELSRLAHETALRVSYYNASEGPNWRAERDKRYAAQERLRKLRDELERRGMGFDDGLYLL